MKTLSSREFRATYAALTEPTLVTAYGRVIGLWTPAQVQEFTVNYPAIPGSVKILSLEEADAARTATLPKPKRGK